MSELPTRYDHLPVEDKWYKHWEEKGYFYSTPDDREPYSIVIPPPNVTGVLHMGHMLNNTIQDALARKARLEGKNVCWVPGTDHASIATEAKVVAQLREQGIKKSDLTRDDFISKAWEWTENYGGIILQQLRKLGASCDWKRTAFTMDEVRSKQVIKAFVDLYDRGKLYRGLRMVNWDPQAQTVLSNEEVLYAEENGKLYHVRYPVVDSEEYITIATTRPETILADTAVAVHPDDDRYHHLKGRKVRVPLTDREVPIIFDDYVERDFGTGALKVTPAHDPNDYEIGKRHDLVVIDMFLPDGRVADTVDRYQDMDRFDVRKKITKDLDTEGYLVETEDYPHSVGRSERTNAVIEPRLSLQWYVSMESLAEPALKSVMNDTIRFFPENMKNTYSHWMENIRDWCISRQLWWGHRIPAYYYGDDIFVAETAEDALAQVQQKTGDSSLTLADIRQDEDVLDTWFSSWLWPFSVFDGMEGGTEVEYYYPTSVLVTGWDIIFLWVARMVMAGYEWRDEKPFDHVYFTGMVRDKQRRKMSKSLGNSPDALVLIEDYSADGVRFGMLSSSPAGGDLLFDEKLCEQGRNFSNKIWNALRLIKGWTTDDQTDVKPENTLAIEWIKSMTSATLADIDRDFSQYRLSDALMKIYKIIWGDYCSWFLEMVKPNYGESIEKAVLDQTMAIKRELMVILHPFMPFVSEEVYQQVNRDNDQPDCMMATWPAESDYDQDLLKTIETLQDIVTKIRDTRNSNGIAMKEGIALSIQSGEFTSEFEKRAGLLPLLSKMANLSSVEIVDEAPDTHAATLVSGVTKVYFPLPESNKEEEIAKLKEELQYAQGFVNSIQKKLSNEKFVNNAPEQVVANERKKLEDGRARVAMLEESLQRLT